MSDITVSRLAGYVRVSERAVLSNIKRGKYSTAHQVISRGKGRGGKVWLINIEDPAIPPEIRTQYYKDLAEKKDQQNNNNLPMADGNKAPWFPTTGSPEPSAGMSSPGTHIGPLYKSQGQVSSNPVPGCLSMEIEQDPSIDSSPAVDRGKGYPSGPSTTPFSLPGHGESGESLVPCGKHVEQVQIGTMMSAPAAFSEKAKKIAIARVDLVRAWRKYRKNRQSLTDADREFQDGYNGGFIQKNLHDVLRDVSTKTLHKWHSNLGNTLDWTRLIPLNLNKKEKGSQLSKDEQDVFLKILLSPRKIKIESAVHLTQTYLRNKGIPSDKSARTFRRFAEKYKAENNDRWVFMREGEKALRDKVMPHINRDPSLLEVGQVLVADGHRLDFQIINPFTGKPCRAVLLGYLDWKSYDLAGYEIMLEENTQCVASALRASIIRLGKIPQFTYQDNGKAFRSRFFTETESLEEIGVYGLFGRLGITPIFSRPYNARAKIIEGWFRVFSNYFERLMSSYTGMSTSDKPAWRLRNEKFHKALHGEYIPTIEETKEFINEWLTWQRSQRCPHVEGKSIGEVFEEGKGPGVDADGLDDLMMAVRLMKIGRNGIRFLKNDYYDDHLYGLRGVEGVFKYDLCDLSSIKVYDLNGQYLCTAKKRVPVHPLANYLGNAKDMEALRWELSLQKNAKRKTMKGIKELKMIGSPLTIPWSGEMGDSSFETSRDQYSSLDEAMKEFMRCLPGAFLSPEDRAAIEEQILAKGLSKTFVKNFGLEVRAQLAMREREERRIPDEALKGGTPIEVPRSLPERSIPFVEFLKMLISEIGPISKEFNQSLRAKYGESIEISQVEEAIRDCTSRPLFESEIERYQWHLVNGFQNEEDLKFKGRFIQTEAYHLGFKFFDDQETEIKKQKERAAAAQL